MADSLFASLLRDFDKGSISQIASSLGESERNVAKGMEMSVGSILGALLTKSGDPNGLHRLLDLAPSSYLGASWRELSAGLSGSDSSWINTGKQALSGIFGTAQSLVIHAVARDAGVGTAAASMLLAMAAPLTLGALCRRVQDEGWSMRQFGYALNAEAASIRRALPPGVNNLLWPRELAARGDSGVVAQSVKRDAASFGWMAPVALSATALACFWLWTHTRKPLEAASVRPVGEASRLADEALRLGDFVSRRLPDGFDLRVPVNGMEARLLSVINSADGAASETWVDFDRLRFDSASATLRPGSSPQLDGIAAILKAYPQVRIKLAGFTDNAGNAEQNLELSRARAEAVKGELVARGISAGRILTEGFGETASADNTTDAGRAGNRRVSLQVTQR